MQANVGIVRTHDEMIEALQGVFGTYREMPVF